MNIDKIINGFITAALWAEDLEDYTLSDSEKQKAKEYIKYFISTVPSDILDRYAQYYDEEQIGHDLWLTQKGHGAGFWDREHPDNLGDVLSMYVQGIYPIDIILNENGKLVLE